jgi:PAS domain S-box-containing protein
MDEYDQSPGPGNSTAETLQQHVAQLEAQLADRDRLVAEQQRLNDLVPLLIAKAGFDGYYHEVNAAFERVLGWTREESLSRPFLEFIHADDRAAAIAAFDRLKTGEPAIDFLDRNLCRDGSHRWIRWIVLPIPDQEHVFGIGQDVTQWKLAEDDRCRADEAIRQSEQRLRLHVEQTPLAVIEWDTRLCVSAWNAGAERIFGYSQTEATGRYFDFIVPATECPHVDQIWAALRTRRGGARSTNENVTKDGRTILCEWYNTPLVDADGQVVGFASLAQDITEQVRAEAALRESERRLATVISNLPGAVYRCRADAQWTVEFLSDGYRALTGIDPSELLGRPGTRHSELIHPEDRQREFDTMQAAMAQKRHFQVEYRMYTASGEQRWIWEQGTGVYSEHGELEAIEGFSTDITDRKEAEAALQRAHDELEQRIRERTAALESEQRALRRMMMASDHERRLVTYELHDGVAQQLTAAVLQLQVLEQQLGQPAAVATAACEAALVAVRRASAELRGVMSRLRTPVLDKFGLVDAIEDMVTQLQTAQGSPRIEYHHEVAFRRLEPTLENALFRISQEALTNACRHSQSDRVHIELTQSERGGVLEVRDWGCGFHQHRVTENRFGLEGIRERARLLGGTCTIRSEPGQGTVVRVEFPVLEQPGG